MCFPHVWSLCKCWCAGCRRGCSILVYFKYNVHGCKRHENTLRGVIVNVVYSLSLHCLKVRVYTKIAAAQSIIQVASQQQSCHLSRETPSRLDRSIIVAFSSSCHLCVFRQVVRCAIISLAKEAGGRHIELSLRASVLNKGLSLSQLTKGSGVYGSVTSAEDHGYVVSLGLDGVTAFLPKKDAPEAGLVPGQPVETVIQASRMYMKVLLVVSVIG